MHSTHNVAESRMQCESNYDYQCTCHSSTHQTHEIARYHTSTVQTQVPLVQARTVTRQQVQAYIHAQVQVASHATLAPGTARTAQASYGRVHTDADSCHAMAVGPEGKVSQATLP